MIFTRFFFLRFLFVAIAYAGQATCFCFKIHAFTLQKHYKSLSVTERIISTSFSCTQKPHFTYHSRCALSIKHSKPVITVVLSSLRALAFIFDCVKPFCILFYSNEWNFLSCRVGEGRACWSLGNAHTALGNHETALDFAQKHLGISKEVTLNYTNLLYQ